MKIAYLSSPPFADCDIPLISEWQRMGHDVSYIIDLPAYFLHNTIIDISNQIQQDAILSGDSYSELLLFSDMIDLSKTHIVNRTHNSIFHPSNICLQFKLISLLKRLNPDVIVTTSYPELFGTLIYKFRKKLVMVVHDPFPHTGESSLRKRISRTLALKTIPKFVIFNQSQFREFLEYWHLKPSQVSVNRLGSYDCTRLFLKNSHKRDSSVPSILFYGRISPYKGIEYLCEAMTLVHQVLPKAHLTVAGAGKMYFDSSKYEELPYINFINRFISTADLAEMLEKCSVNVCPYTDATQSGVVQTTFAMNRAVIATNVGGMKEYIQDGKTGLLVEPRDPEALAQAIIRVLENDCSLRNEIEQNIEALKTNDEHSWHGIAQKYIDFFHKEIGK